MELHVQLLTVVRHSRGVIFSALLIGFAPYVANAQPRSHAYATLGVGPGEIAGGVDLLVAGGPVGVRGEVGLLAPFIGASYHVLRHQLSTRQLDMLVSAGYLSFTDLNYEDKGARVGGGIVYWRYARVGLLFEAFGFVPTRDDIRTPHQHWGIRGGAAFAFRSR